MLIRKSISDVVDRFEACRVQARQSTESALSNSRVKLVGMTNVLAARADFWKNYSNPYREPAPWSWTRAWTYYQRQPKNFNVCILHQGILCGLSLGRPSHHQARLRFELVEGNPDPAHPLRGLVIRLSLACAEAYAIAIGASEVRVMNPVTSLLSFYINEKYTYVPGGSKRRDHAYLWRSLQ